jgi:hypothetical protein
MTEYSLYARKVSPKAVIDAVIGLGTSPRPLSDSDMAEIIEKNDRYARAVTHLLTELDIATTAGGDYVANSSIEEEARKLSQENGHVLLNRHLLRYEPFMTFVSLLSKGFDPDRSAQYVITLYELDMDPGLVRSQFLDLGRYAEILTEDAEPEPTVEVESLPTAYVDELTEALESEAKARLFVHNRLGEEVVSYVDHESIEKLQRALMKFREDPETAIVDCAAAAETISRDIAEDEGGAESDYSTANGIGQVVQRLSGDDVILKRHLHGANYLGSMRTPGSHGKEKETLEFWEVDEDVALQVILATLDYIRSLYWYGKRDRQLL